MNWYKLAYKSLSEKELDAFIKHLDKPIWIPVESCFIDAIAYHKEARVLEIKIKGTQYTFFGISNKTFKDFANSPSKGKFFNEIIKLKYKYLQK